MNAIGKVSPPPQLQLGTGEGGLNNLLGNIVGLFFAAGGLAFIIMFVWGAVAMILSGGDKEAVAKARARITWAIIGIFLLSLSFFIMQLIEYITGITLFV